MGLLPGCQCDCDGRYDESRPRYPTIDYANGGSLNGIIATVNNYLAITNGQTKYVPGHGPLATRADIVRYRDMLTSVRYLVRAEIQAGKPKIKQW